MKNLFLLFTLVLTTGMAAAQSFALENYRWKNRVLLVFAPDEHDGLYQRQTALANEARAGYRERDLVVVSVFTESGRDEKNSILQKGQTRQLRTDFWMPNDRFCVILIGKDGGEKLRQADVLATEKLFGVIDAMPMRQSESKRKNERELP